MTQKRKNVRFTISKNKAETKIKLEKSDVTLLTLKNNIVGNGVLITQKGEEIFVQISEN